MRQFDRTASGLLVPRERRLSTPKGTRPLMGSSQQAMLMAGGVAGDPQWANVSLLVHFDNIGGNPFDNSVNNYSPSVNSAVINGTQPKWGAGASASNGTNTYIGYLPTTPLDFTTGDFALEAWVRFNAIGVAQVLMERATGTGFYAWALFVNAAGKLNFVGYDTSNALAFNIVGGTTLVANTYYFVQGLRNTNTFTLGLNGVSEGTASYSGSLHTLGTDLIYLQTQGGSAVLNGYLDEVRLTKAARSLSLPTAAFPNF